MVCRGKQPFARDAEGATQVKAASFPISQVKPFPKYFRMKIASFRLKRRVAHVASEAGQRRRTLMSLLILAGAIVGTVGCGSGSGGPKTGAPTLVFSANTTTIVTGQSVTLSWQSTNATSVTITAVSGSSTRTVEVSSQLSGSVMDTPAATTTYTAVASGNGGTTAPQNMTVQVTAGGPVTITTFTATPTAVSGGQTATITWATANATSVTITPPVSTPDDTGPLSTSGSSVVVVNATTTFTINASGPGGNATPAMVTVNVPFTVGLTASPSTITSGQAVTLSWQVTGGTASSLSIDNNVCASCALPQGTASVSPSATTTYKASATAADGSIIQQSATVTVGPPAAGAIKHIFFMIQENRSFDMYLGQLAPYRANRLAGFGITDTQTINSFDPTVTLTNIHTGAKVKPFHEATECTENLSPAWDESHHDAALVGGDAGWNTATTFTDSSFLNNGYLDTTGSVTQAFDPNGTRAMGFYNNQDLPYYYDLATFFATSDSWHSPILANSIPNRLYLMAASSFGHEYPDFDGNHPKYAAPTLFRAMNTANVSWLYYYKDGIFLAHFSDFTDPAIGPKTVPVSNLISRLQGSCNGTPCDADATLPQVIFIESASGGSGLDEHPDNNVQTGAAFVQSIIGALMNSTAWHDSVFILSYDEAGGLYDHVSPFQVPPPDAILPGQCPDPNNGSSGYCTVGKIGGQFNVTGFRVPVMVISPFAKPHFISHVPRDYTAILAFVEQTFNVPSLTARDAFWKDPSRDMNEFFDFSTPALLTAPNGQPWTTVLPTQTPSGVCDRTKEAGPTF